MNTKTYAIVMPLRLALTELNASLPFCEFGRSGGYGTIRSKLVASVKAHDWVEAQRWFDTLVAEGFQDIYDECRFDCEAEGRELEYTSPDAVRRDWITRAVDHPELTDSGRWVALV